jgi:hypothetical protein
MDYSSQDQFKPDFYKVKDPILDYEPKLKFPVIKGGVQTTERAFPSTTYSNTSIQFSTPPPSPNVFVSRKVLLKVPVQIAININNAPVGGATGATLVGYDALRQAPLHSIIKSMDVTINGQSSTLDVNDVVHPLLLYHDNDRMLTGREYSTSPFQRDVTQQYLDLQSVGAAGAQVDPSIANPLNALVFGGQLNGTHPRGVFPGQSVFFDNGGGAGANRPRSVMNYTLCEELMISPLLYGGVEDQGFYGIQSFEVNINLDSAKLNRIWSRVVGTIGGVANSHPKGPDNVTTITVTILPTPELLFRYSSPPLNMSIPRSLQYSYNNIRRYIKGNNGINLAVDASNDFISDNIQLNCIPRFLYIFARKKLSDKTYLDTDSYLGIENITVNWNNQNALLSNASKQQLYDISRKNGCVLSWWGWSADPDLEPPGGLAAAMVTKSGLGSVLCLEFGTDIALYEDEAPGLIGTYNLQVQANCTNRSSAVIGNIDFVMITITPGCFTIYDNAASKRIGVLSKQDILTAQEIAGMDYEQLQQGLMSGGIKFKQIARMAYHLGKKASPFIRKLVPAQYQGMFDLGESLVDKLYNLFLKEPAPTGESKDKKVLEIAKKMKTMPKSQVKSKLQMGMSMVGGAALSQNDMAQTLGVLGI